MAFTLHGIPVSRGIVIGRVHLLASAALEVPHYLVVLGEVDREVARLDEAIATVVNELYQLQAQLPTNAPAEFAALVDLHRLILQDPLLSEDPARLIRERRYNAEWALTTQLQAVVEQFGEMDDEYIASRRADVEQVVERVLKVLTGSAHTLSMIAAEADAARQNGNRDDFEPMVIIAHDIAPADMLQFKKQVFAGFATDLGSQTAHTAILAKSLDIPAVVGLGQASRLLRQDECVIIDGETGVLVVDPSPIVLDEYRLRKRDLELAHEKLKRLARMPTRTLDDQPIELHANIELPDDCAFANEVGATGIGLFRTEFLFMTRDSMPDEEEQFEAYRRVVVAMSGRPVTIRTLDIGADKTPSAARLAFGDAVFNTTNPALGLRAIRFCLAEPQIFLAQLRAILRASAFGPVKLLIPMIAHPQEVDAALVLIATAKGQLEALGVDVRSRPADRRDDRDPGGRADPAGVREAPRLLLDRHERPDPVHARDRPHRQRGRAPVRPAASGRARDGRADHRDVEPSRHAGLGVRRDGRRSDARAAAARPRAEAVLDASGAAARGQVRDPPVRRRGVRVARQEDPRRRRAGPRPRARRPHEGGLRTLAAMSGRAPA